MCHNPPPREGGCVTTTCTYTVNIVCSDLSHQFATGFPTSCANDHVGNDHRTKILIGPFVRPTNAAFPAPPRPLRRGPGIARNTILPPPQREPPRPAQGCRAGIDAKARPNRSPAVGGAASRPPPSGTKSGGVCGSMGLRYGSMREYAGVCGSMREYGTSWLVYVWGAAGRPLTRKDQAAPFFGQNLAGVIHAGVLTARPLALVA